MTSCGRFATAAWRPEEIAAVGAAALGGVAQHVRGGPVADDRTGGRVNSTRVPAVTGPGGSERGGVGYAVRRPRIERRGLRLRRLEHLAEHLAGAGLGEARLGTDLAHGLQQARHADARELGRQGRLDPRHGDERHRGKVVDLVRLRRAPNHPVHLVAVVEQQLGQVRAVPTRYPVIRVRFALTTPLLLPGRASTPVPWGRP
jgi:hypothetical protein